jgi:hypothetical protein
MGTGQDFNNSSLAIEHENAKSALELVSNACMRWFWELNPSLGPIGVVNAKFEIHHPPMIFDGMALSCKKIPDLAKEARLVKVNLRL